MRLLIIRLFILLGLIFPALAAAAYTDNHDGTVTDTATGLTWMRCAMGQTWDGSTCIGTASTYTWDQARALTSSFAGKSDWRMPNMRELQTIVDRSRYIPAIDLTAFPNTPASVVFWSGSPNANGSNVAWYVDFSYGNAGYSGYYVKLDAFSVRLVRGGQSLALLSDARPDTDYTDNGDGTVTHKPTGLMWKKCSEGQAGSTCTGTATTFTWDQAMALTGSFAGKSDWRLPTENELLSLADYTKNNPAINATFFPGTPSLFIPGTPSLFWSGSPYAFDSSYAWNVNFVDGYASGYSYNRFSSKDSTFFVRLVRGGQSLGNTGQTSISDARVFAYAAANYPSLFSGTPTAGQYQQYDYRYYQASKNYLAVDDLSVVWVMGPVFTPPNKPIRVGSVESFRGVITAWEATQTPPGSVSQSGLTWMPVSSTHTYAQATALCAGAINGQTGWRLPTVAELFGLKTPPAWGVGTTTSVYGSGEAINPGWTSINTWSSTPGDGGTGTHYDVSLVNGDVNWDYDTGSHYVTCVR